MSILMGNKNLQKYNKPIKFYQINSSRHIMIKIITLKMETRTVHNPINKHIALHQKHINPTLVIDTTLTEHMQVKIQMIIFIQITNLKNKELSQRIRIKIEMNMMRTKKMICKTKETQNLIEMINAPDLKRHGNNTWGKNNNNKQKSTLVKHHSKEKWEID